MFKLGSEEIDTASVSACSTGYSLGVVLHLTHQRKRLISQANIKNIEKNK